jgi:hypothetical protein
MASSGRLARVLQLTHSTSSQPSPPLRHCSIVGAGCAGPPYPSIRTDQASALGAVGRADGFPGFLPRVVGADFRATDAAAPDDLARLGAHDAAITAVLAAVCNATRISGEEHAAIPRLRQCAICTRSPPTRSSGCFAPSTDTSAICRRCHGCFPITRRLSFATQRVGWVERLVRRSSTSDDVGQRSRSAGGRRKRYPSTAFLAMVGFAGTNPSNVLGRLPHGEERVFARLEP